MESVRRTGSDDLPWISEETCPFRLQLVAESMRKATCAVEDTRISWKDRTAAIDLSLSRTATDLVSDERRLPQTQRYSDSTEHSGEAAHRSTAMAMRHLLHCSMRSKPERAIPGGESDRGGRTDIHNHAAENESRSVCPCEIRGTFGQWPGSPERWPAYSMSLWG